MLALHHLLWQRANAQNISFEITLQWPIYIINSVDETKLSFQSCRVKIKVFFKFKQSMPIIWFLKSLPVSKLKRSLNQPNSASSCSDFSVSKFSSGPNPPKKIILVPIATQDSLSRGDGGTPLHVIFCHCFVSETVQK